MSFLTPLLGRRAEAAESAQVRRLNADLTEAHRQNVALAVRLRAETARADRAEQALDTFRTGIRAGHEQLLQLVARLQREIELLRRDREGAISQLEAALGYDEKTIATINAGGISKAAA